MNVPVDEAREMMGEIGGRGMGYLFENMEKMDIQAEHSQTMEYSYNFSKTCWQVYRF